jgi:hypothetical protein
MGESDIDLAVKTSRRLEALLETRYGATGRGLHEKLAAVEAMLPPEALRNGRYVATMRNKVVHEDAFSLPDRARFVSCAAEFERALGAKAATAGARFPWGVLICLAGFAVMWKGALLVPAGRSALTVATEVAVVGFLMLSIPPTVWVRARIRRRGQPVPLMFLIVVFVFSFVVAAIYVPLELGRYVIGTLRRA